MNSATLGTARTYDDRITNNWTTVIQGQSALREHLVEWVAFEEIGEIRFNPDAVVNVAYVGEEEIEAHPEVV